MPKFCRNIPELVPEVYRINIYHADGRHGPLGYPIGTEPIAPKPSSFKVSESVDMVKKTCCTWLKIYDYTIDFCESIVYTIDSQKSIVEIDNIAINAGSQQPVSICHLHVGL